MKKYIFIIVVILFSFLLWRDYRNYYIGRSLINYHMLPFGLNTESLSYEMEINGKYKKITDFSFIYNEYECMGAGCSIPSDTYYPRFTIKLIIGYYYNKKDVIIKCEDMNTHIRYIKPCFRNNDVAFDEITEVKEKNLLNYKYIPIRMNQQ